MIATIIKQGLQAAIASPARVAASSMLAYLSCIRIEADDGLAFEATDMTESVRTTAAALVEVPGRALLPASRLASIVKSLPDAAVTIDEHDGRAEISCGHARFTLPTLDADELPAFPKPEEGSEVSMPFDTFADLTRRAAIAASKDDNRPILTGVLVESSDGSIRMAATDSYRVSCVEAAVEGAGEFRAVFPAAFLLGASGLKAAGDVTLSVGENQVRIECDGATLVSRTIEGTYPAWERLFPADCGLRAKIDSSAFSGSLSRAAVAGGGKAPVEMRFDDVTASIRCDGGEEGTLSEDLDCSVTGEGFAKASCKYLSDALATVGPGAVEILINRPTDPIVIEGEGAKALVMPVR